MIPNRYRKIFYPILPLFCIVTWPLQGQEKPGKPNIVFVLVDDLGWSDLGFMGSENYNTPNVDKLATEGMVFTDFYAAGPVCSPTRASILTGKNPARTGVTTYLITPDQDVDYMSDHLALPEYTLAEALRDNGYVTGLFGKWHLGYEAQHWASNQGFMTAIGGTTSRNAWKMLYPDRQPPVDQLENLYFSPHFLTHMDNGPKGEYLTDRLTNETIDFMQDNARRGKAFFAFLSFHTVHTPLEAKSQVMDYYDEKFSKEDYYMVDIQENGSRKYQNMPEYAAMVQHMDENVGKLMDWIDKLGIRENTIVVFTSDNGGKHSVTSNAPLRGAKHNLYEGGIRVPLIVRWPGYVDPNSTYNEPLISNDFYPTLLDLVNLNLIPEQHVDGVSFKSVLFGNPNPVPREALCWHYPHGVFQGAVRMGNYKLIFHYKTGEVELFDLSNDISESNDISNSNQEIVDKLRNMLKKWLEDNNARFPDSGVVMP